MNIPHALSGTLGVVVLLAGVEFTADGTRPPSGIPFAPAGPATLPQYQATYTTAINQPYQNVGDWSTPVNVGAPINTEYNDNYAVLSRDELTIYFTSDRPGSLGGDDLWVSRRESTDSPWSPPVNLTALN